MNLHVLNTIINHFELNKIYNNNDYYIEIDINSFEAIERELIKKGSSLIKDNNIKNIEFLNKVKSDFSEIKTYRLYKVEIIQTDNFLISFKKKI